MSMQQLMFTVGLIDQITKPIAKISHSLNGLTNDYQRGTMKMASGVAGIAASGYALQNALMPAIEMDRVLGEVKSLGVRESALKQLTDSSYEYALKYGKSATEFVSSSYDIQSAIAGLNDADLSAFTMSSNVLAAATKSDAATITNYMGTMYGIFETQANGMGKSKWVEQVTGMTATAVQAFKTTGTEMSAAFTSIGGAAAAKGIDISEQMAVLGTLQATMSGSEAGTKYASFLAGVGKAQSALGLEFTDSAGRMLPMVNILSEIKGKFGDVIDVAEGDQLAKAFGSKNATALIDLLMPKIDGLSDSINELGQVTGMERAEKMAMDMTDQSERLSASWYVIRAALGSVILPAFNDFVGKIADMGTSVINFTEEFPELTKWLGYAFVGILGLVAAGGLVSVVMGASTMAMTTWNLVLGTAVGIGSGYMAVLTGIRTGLSWLTFTTISYYSKLWVKNKAMAVSQLVTTLYGNAVDRARLALTRFNTIATFTGGYLPALSAVMRGAAVSTWSFVASLAAAVLPITLIIAAVGLLAVAVYKYWKPIKAFFGGFWDGFTESFAPVISAFSGLLDSLGGMFSWVGEQLGFSSDELAGFAEAGKTFGSIIGFIFNLMLMPIQFFIEILTGAINLVKDAIGLFSELFGFEDLDIDVNANIAKQYTGRDMPSPYHASIPSIYAIAPVKSRVERGGITQQISNANQQKSTHVGTVNVYPAKGETNFANLVEMHS
ncbi:MULTISPECIES: phage tail tape measure protein [unclassified Pseudoalteromonas]|uniref:phage tail tape measure protein n=1 Tax=unclassified Pseudoalteromonas TaxID=194690 RepID=UPI002175F085|nr:MULTISPECIES: phage tail tape measure protein [unclassified Pseudoalteromonas]